MKQLLNIVKALCDAPEKIQELEVLAMSTSDEGVVKMKKKRQSEQYQGECVGAFFNGTKVKKVGGGHSNWMALGLALEGVHNAALDCAGDLDLRRLGIRCLGATSGSLLLASPTTSP